MQQIITLLHILVSICIIGLVLVQRGKGAEAGAGFAGGGASGTMFGSQGSTPFLVKLTGGLAIVFFITSSVLSFIVGQEVTKHNPMPLIPAGQTSPIPTSPTSLHYNYNQSTGEHSSSFSEELAHSHMPMGRVRR